jgi:hypothetical protein
LFLVIASEAEAKLAACGLLWIAAPLRGSQ